MRKRVTIFGSSIPLPGDAEYEAAYRLGKRLGDNNIDVCTGGFRGIMDAASKGAREAGAESIGVTVNVFNSHASSYLSKEIKCSTLIERLSKLVEMGDGYIILNGGTGTMLELALVWESINKNLLAEKPCAAVGPMWRSIIEKMEIQIERERRKKGIIKCFDEVEECASYIITSLGC